MSTCNRLDLESKDLEGLCPITSRALGHITFQKPWSRTWRNVAYTGTPPHSTLAIRMEFEIPAKHGSRRSQNAIVRTDHFFFSGIE